VPSIIAISDLPLAVQSAELVEAMVAGANAKAARVAPCLTWDGTVTDQPSPTEDQLAEARLVLIGAIRRWADAGAGAFTTQTAGPFSVATDTRQRTGYNLWPSEIEALQDICSAGKDTSSGAFSITPTARTGAHMPWCALAFGATYCSCGADLTADQYPLYEGGVLSGDEY
jgi:hypothetical protein